MANRNRRRVGHGVRDDRAFERLPILADALEEAGCDDELVLLHCRECANHAPDCWVVSFCVEGDPLERPAEVAERVERDRQRWLAWEAAKAADWQKPPSRLDKWPIRFGVLLGLGLFAAGLFITVRSALEWLTGR